MSRCDFVWVIALGAFGALALDAADFLTQAELDERLGKLRAELPAWIGVVHRDRCYQSAKGHAAYEYRCPTCGYSTGYRDEVGQGCMSGVSNTIVWARESVAKLRALRLDISIDERGFCDKCRSALMTVELRWSINGRSVNIYDRTDILILETFLKGERRLPNWNGPDWDIMSICHMRRLEELLGAKGKINNWYPAYPLLKTEGVREPHSLTNHPYGEVEVEVDI